MRFGKVLIEDSGDKVINPIMLVHKTTMSETTGTSRTLATAR